MVYADVEVESETVDFGRRQRSNEDVRTPSPEETLEDTVASATSSPTKVRYKLLESNAILLIGLIILEGIFLTKASSELPQL